MRLCHGLGGGLESWSLSTYPKSRLDHYTCFDFVLRSDIGLPELTPCGAADRRQPIVDIRTGPVSARLDEATGTSFGLQVSGAISVLTIANVARYRVSEGREIIVDPHPNAAERDVRLFLLGSALAILCYQRGLLLLHANAVVANNAAFAFAGESQAGKSTLAAYFHHAGRQVLCDDVCAVSFDSAGRPCAWPGLPRLKLWGSATRLFGYDPTALEAVLEGIDKYHVPLVRPPASGPMPLRRLHILSRADVGELGEIRRLRGVEAIRAIFDHSYRGHYLAPMGLTRRHFDGSAALLGAIEVYAASRVWGFEAFEREAERLAMHLDTTTEEAGVSV